MKRATLLFLVAMGAQAQFTADEMLKPAAYTNRLGEVMNYRLAAPQFPEAGRKYPLILFFHGSGECGSDNLKQIKVGVPELVKTLLKRPRPEPVMIVAPQCTISNRFIMGLARDNSYAMPAEPAPALEPVLELVRHLVAEKQADAERLYITGLSLGGFTTWDVIQREPEMFAAAVPICGGGDTRAVRQLKHLPIWVFHGTLDKSVPVDCSRRMVRALKQGGNRKVRYTEYENGEHNVWGRAYSSAEMIEWMLEQSRAKKPWWKFW